jgi:single-strand DNA-binding protein
MAGVNKVILIGHLGGDVELRFTGSGEAVANFNLATSEQWKGRDGAKQERTEWHRIVVWGKLAELCGEYLAKGRKAYIEGSLQTRKYEKDGVERYVTEIKAREVQFLDSKQSESAPAPKQNTAPAQKTASNPRGMPLPPAPTGSGFGNLDPSNDDTPF